MGKCSKMFVRFQRSSSC